MERLLTELMGRPVRVVDSRVVGGGCIADSRRMRLQDESGNETDWFVKSQAMGDFDALCCEARGLRLLAASNQILTPEPLGPVSDEHVALLALPWLETGSHSPAFFRNFGQQLARHHRATEGNRLGLDHDNFLGRSPQINQTDAADWIAFFAQCRLEPQIRWARDSGLADQRLSRRMNDIQTHLSDLLDGREDVTSLLHGDLWSGNYMAVANAPGVAWIDPAVSWGCREMEFGMLRLFGGCPRDFYEAYQEEYRMPDGWEDRVDVYVLYHLLNHLNLFGVGYLNSCMEVADRILRR
ncbi:MAG: fructosamine kinase family protein [Planctomycetota bacterium]